MTAGLFVLTPEGDLRSLKPARFSSEDGFQTLLARYPDLLAGDQIAPDNPRRWLLVAREQPIPSEEGGAGRWSIDHLFVDQDAIPTLVEVKRQSDTRLRREVIGQMLDYAANGVRHWRAEQLAAAHGRSCGNPDPAQDIRTRLGVDEEPAVFWARVAENLRAGRLRLLFVADEIPSELKAIVEFLNRSMSQVEVLAVELRQYEGEGLRTIVPLVHGHTAETREAKHAADKQRSWDRDGLLAAAAQHGPERAAFTRAFLDWASSSSGRLHYGKGKGGSAIVSYALGSREVGLIYFDLLSGVGMPLAELRKLQVLGDPRLLSGFWERANACLRAPLTPDTLNKGWPYIRFDRFKDGSSLLAYLDLVEGTVEAERSRLASSG